MLPLLLLSSLLLATATAQLGPPPQQGDNIPPKVAPTRFENFTYSDPFTAPTTSSCSHSRAFPALEYQLHDLSSDASSGQPGLLRAYRAGLKSLFSDRPYPGGWDGMDAHGYEREVVGMRWEDVPRLVQGWIAEQEDEGKLFGVFDKEGKPVVDEEEGGEMVMFAPGAVYETLPLWVAEGSGCEDTMQDLSKYSSKLVDGGVVGWVTEHTRPARDDGERAMKFVVKAEVLALQDSGKDEL